MSVSSMTAPFNGTQSGTFVSSRGGNETFSRSIATQAGTRSADTVLTRANGMSVTRDATFTRTATGWTRSVTTTRADGATTSLQTTGTRQADGSMIVAGMFTGADGTSQSVAGTSAGTGDTRTMDLSFTNAAGQVRTADRQISISGNQVMGAETGTNFNGSAFSNTSALTILQSQEQS